MIMSLKQNKIKVNPRIKLNHNRYILTLSTSQMKPATLSEEMKLKKDHLFMEILIFITLIFRSTVLFPHFGGVRRLTTVSFQQTGNHSLILFLYFLVNRVE